MKFVENIWHNYGNTCFVSVLTLNFLLTDRCLTPFHQVIRFFDNQIFAFTRINLGIQSHILYELKKGWTDFFELCLCGNRKISTAQYVRYTLYYLNISHYHQRLFIIFRAIQKNAKYAEKINNPLRLIFFHWSLVKEFDRVGMYYFPKDQWFNTIL